MKAYGSRRIYDTPPQMKAARARVKREGDELAREQMSAGIVNSDGDPVFCNCGARATWHYMPGEGDYCDGCVPRGCTCQDDPNEPCVEFMEV